MTQYQGHILNVFVISQILHNTLVTLTHSHTWKVSKRDWVNLIPISQGLGKSFYKGCKTRQDISLQIIADRKIQKA